MAAAGGRGRQNKRGCQAIVRSEGVDGDAAADVQRAQDLHRQL